MNPPVADVGNISGIFLENCYMEKGNGKFKENYIKSMFTNSLSMFPQYQWVLKIRKSKK